MKYFLGVDVGGTKTHALIADEAGQALGFGSAGPGNWEGVGYDGLTRVLLESTGCALERANVRIDQIMGAGMGIGGFDWPNERQDHLDAIKPLGLSCPLEIVNDATLGILAGASEGWGVSVVAGTGCNARGWSRDHKRQGRAIGGGGYWSGEYAGGYDIVARAMRAVAFEWLKRGPRTALTQVFLDQFGAKDLDDLVEGVYMQRYQFVPGLVLKVFETARLGDPQAQEVMRWAGDELGQMAVGVINQLDLQKEGFEVVLIGSLHHGSPILNQTLRETILKAAPSARFVRLTVPPVVGGVLLGMEEAGLNGYAMRDKLISTTKELLAS
ncbi:MAG TPA: BadF/BadG/BcrA/BcrD ATPase family protein [Anaerolineales bacterium]|nr:BadF/BadG/BcrA/BcrD ATPase family protein [Anaerolineales bacterium]